MRGRGAARGLPAAGCPLPAALRPLPGPGSRPSVPARPSCPRRRGSLAPPRPSAGLLAVRIATRSRTRAGGRCEGV